MFHDCTVKISPFWSSLALVVTLFGTRADAALSYGTAGANYTETFDTLASTGTTNAYAQDSTIAGFYAFNSGAFNGGSGRVSGNVDNVAPASWQTPANYVGFTGSTTGSRLNAYGSYAALANPTNPAAERGIGTLAGSTSTASPGDWFFGMAFQNTTGAALDSFTLNYTGEQWVQTNLTAPATSQRLRFDYLVVANFSAQTDLPTQAGFGAYTAVPALDFVSLQNTATAAGAIDGNAASNRTTLSQTVPVAIPAGSSVILRWFDDDDNGNDVGLGIDDLTFSATAATAVTPEPASLAALVAAGCLMRRARRA